MPKGKSIFCWEKRSFLKSPSLHKGQSSIIDVSWFIKNIAAQENTSQIKNCKQNLAFKRIKVYIWDCENIVYLKYTNDNSKIKSLKIEAKNRTK